MYTKLIPSQTNSTRAKTLELHIAQRVAAELEKIKQHESSAVEEARKRIAAAGEALGSSSSSDSSSSGNSLLQMPSLSPKDLLESGEEKERKAQTSAKVQQEIEKLKQTLSQRKILKDLPGEVESAYVFFFGVSISTLSKRVASQEGNRSLRKLTMTTPQNRRQDVISCLRINDRKPLDCWKEVEIFKRAVRKMEESYVSSVL